MPVFIREGLCLVSYLNLFHTAYAHGAACSYHPRDHIPYLKWFRWHPSTTMNWNKNEKSEVLRFTLLALIHFEKNQNNLRNLSKIFPEIHFNDHKIFISSRDTQTSPTISLNISCCLMNLVLSELYCIKFENTQNVMVLVYCMSRSSDVKQNLKSLNKVLYNIKYKISRSWAIRGCKEDSFCGILIVLEKHNISWKLSDWIVQCLQVLVPGFELIHQLSARFTCAWAFYYQFDNVRDNSVNFAIFLSFW